MPISLSGSLSLTGSLTVSGSMIYSGSVVSTQPITASAFLTTGTITAQTLVVSTISSSVEYSSGSNIFGNSLTNQQIFTGSLNVTGSTHSIFGNLGIGTTSPSQRFEVVGGEMKAGRIDSVSEGGQLSFGRALDNNTSWYIDLFGNASSPQLRFVDVDNSAVRMVLTGSNMGIGTASPSYFVDVTAGTAGNFATPALRVSTSTGGAGGATMLQLNHTANSVSGLQIIQYGATPGNGASITNTENSYLTLGTCNTERMRITASGSVGIGVGNVLSWYNGGYTALQIGGMSGLFANTSNTSVTGASTYTYNIYTDSAGNYQYINTTNARAGSLISLEGGNISFGNVPAATSANPTVSTRMYICSNGSVGIGTTTLSTEANLYLGAQGATEGGQLVLQKATNCNCATHLDNYQNSFRVMSGTDTASTTVNMSINHLNSNFGINISPACTQFQIRKNFWSFWIEKSHNANVGLFSINLPDMGAAIINIAGSRYSPGSDNYSGTTVWYTYVNNVGSIAGPTVCQYGTYSPSTYISGKTVTFCSLYAGTSTNYTGVSVTVQASGHNNGSESPVVVYTL